MSTRSALWTLLLLGCGALTSAQEGGIPWRTNLQTALQGAKEDQKVLVFFYAPG